MNTFNILFGIASATGLFAWILYLIFAQITVRKLERNPHIRENMGFEPISGWRILSVAEALAWPKAFFDLAQRTPLAGLYADADLIRAHTNRLDRALAHLLCWTFFGSGIALLLLVLTELLGFGA